MKEPSVRPDSIAIGFVHPDTVGWKFTESLINLFLGPTKKLVAQLIQARSGPNTAQARNVLVQTFMKDPTAEWFFSVDADMTWTCDDLLALIELADPVERPIVGALAFESEGGPLRPVLYEFDKDFNFYHLSSYPRDLVKVGLAPVYFGLFHRSVFEKLEDPWFCYYYKDRPTLDESSGFSYRLRDADIPVWIDTRINVGHLRLRPVTEADYPSKKRLENKWWKD